LVSNPGGGNAIASLYEMLNHINNSSVSPRLVFTLWVVILCGSRTFASQKPDFVLLKTHGEGGAIAEYRAYPCSAVKLLFPNGEAVLEPDANSQTWELPRAAILKKIQIARVYDTKRRFNVAAVAFGDQLFVFDEVFSSENPVLMSQLMQATATAPRSEAEALDFARLYLALSYFSQEDPGRFIAYKSGDSTKQHASENARGFAEMIGLSHSPQAVREGAIYHLDFFTYDARGASTKISHWKIDVGAENLKERLSAHHVGFHVPYSNTVSEATQTKGKVLFTPGLMGNGVGNDGATIDLQIWASSDGPGVGRNHYYYKSQEKADRRMQEFLEKAVAILDTRPWLDPSGKTVGTREALIITVNEDNRTLYASQLFEDETSVLEISCGSLSNLLAVQGRELPDWKH
jgi:hypothetical protein